MPNLKRLLAKLLELEVDLERIKVSRPVYDQIIDQAEDEADDEADEDD